MSSPVAGASRSSRRREPAALRPRCNGAYLIGGGLDQTSAEAALVDGRADATVFGGAFLANPDLPERFRSPIPWAIGVPEAGPPTGDLLVCRLTPYTIHGMVRHMEAKRAFYDERNFRMAP